MTCLSEEVKEFYCCGKRHRFVKKPDLTEVKALLREAYFITAEMAAILLYWLPKVDRSAAEKWLDEAFIRGDDLFDTRLYYDKRGRLLGAGRTVRSYRHTPKLA